MQPEKWNEYIKNYQKENCTRYTIICSNEKDNDIISFFESCKGVKRSGLLKKIIRFYIENNQQK